MKRGQERFRLFPAFAVIPFSESALPGIELDLQVPAAVHIASQFLGPFQMVDLALEEFAPQFVAARDLQAVPDDTGDTPNHDDGYADKRKDHDPDCDHDLLSDPDVSPSLHRAPPCRIYLPDEKRLRVMRSVRIDKPVGSSR